MSKVAAAITSPATKAAKQENSTKSFRSIRIRAPSPCCVASVWHPKDLLWQKLGLEGIVSKGLGSPYVSGRSRHWVKSKNPKHPAVKREAEQEWK
jgi:hypothetical protein